MNVPRPASASSSSSSETSSSETASTSTKEKEPASKLRAKAKAKAPAFQVASRYLNGLRPKTPVVEAERPATALGIVRPEPVHIPTDMCKDPRLRKWLQGHVVALKPLLPQSSDERRFGLCREIQRHSLIQSDQELWKGEDYDHIAEIKRRTQELRARTLKLLETEEVLFELAPPEDYPDDKPQTMHDLDASAPPSPTQTERHEHRHHKPPFDLPDSAEQLVKSPVMPAIPEPNAASAAPCAAEPALTECSLLAELVSSSRLSSPAGQSQGNRRISSLASIRKLRTAPRGSQTARQFSNTSPAAAQDDSSQKDDLATPAGHSRYSKIAGASQTMNDLVPSLRKNLGAKRPSNLSSAVRKIETAPSITDAATTKAAKTTESPGDSPTHESRLPGRSLSILPPKRKQLRRLSLPAFTAVTNRSVTPIPGTSRRTSLNLHNGPVGALELAFKNYSNEVYSTSRQIAGFGRLAAKIVVLEEFLSGTLLLRVSGQVKKTAVELKRHLSRQDLNGLLEFGNVKEVNHDVYVWLASILEVRIRDAHQKGKESSAERILCFAGYDEDGEAESDSPDSEEELAASKHVDHVKEIFRAKLRVSTLGADVVLQSLPEAVDKDRIKVSDRERAIEAAARRFDLEYDVAKALFDWYTRLDSDGSGSIEDKEFEVFVRWLFEKTGRVLTGGDQKLRGFWRAAVCREGSQHVDFRQWVDWLVHNFPYFNQMSAKEIRFFSTQ